MGRWVDMRMGRRLGGSVDGGWIHTGPMINAGLRPSASMAPPTAGVSKKLSTVDMMPVGDGPEVYTRKRCSGLRCES